jgi:hypothetical protein
MVAAQTPAKTILESLECPETEEGFATSKKPAHRAGFRVKSLVALPSTD